MKDSLNHNIFAETDCISEQTLFNYIDNKLSAKERHAVEKHLLHCELCSDALEGLEMVKNRKRIGVINEKINERIALSVRENKTTGFNYKIILSVAATLLLLIGGLYFFSLMNQKNEMAVFQPEQSAPEPPPPPPAPNDRAPEASEDPFVSDSPKKEMDNESKADSKQAITLSQEQPPVAAENKKSESYYKTGFNDATGADAGSGVVSRSAVMDEAGEKNIPAGLAETEADIPNEEPRQQIKDSDYDKNEQQGTIAGGASNNERFGTSLIPEASKVSSAKSLTERAMDREELSNTITKKSKKESARELSGFKAKERDIAEKEEKPQSTIAYAPQTITATTDDVKLETVAAMTTLEGNPEYPGGQDSLLLFIRNRFNASLLEKNQELAKQPLQVRFTVDKKGNVKNPKIVKGVNAEMNNEMLRILNLMPKWKPGTINGEPVSKEISLPIQLKK